MALSAARCLPGSLPWAFSGTGGGKKSKIEGVGGDRVFLPVTDRCPNLAAENEEAAGSAVAEQGRALRAATTVIRGLNPTAPLQRRGTGRGGYSGRGPGVGSGATHLTP